jgi:ribosomal-protein-alanine N-acetyltransferase
MTVLETERLIIRNFQAGEWQALHRVIEKYQASNFAQYDQQWPTSIEEIKKVTEWFASGDSFLAVCLKEKNQLIGFIGLNPEDGESQRVLNLGYVFDCDYHGRGYATEACRVVLDRAFTQLQAISVVTGTASINRPSCQLLERLGFQKIGEEMTSFKKAEDGKPIKFLAFRFALSRDEWDKFDN